jgi:exodeoxyribonuclease VII large subunit
MDYKNKKQIFTKNQNKHNVLDDNSTDESENLSDELNQILDNNTNTNTNKSIKYTKYTIPPNISTNIYKPDEFFDIKNILKDISSILNLNYNIKIIGEIISFKITDGNAWINIKSDEFQLLTIFWKINVDKNYNELKTTKPGEKFIFEGKFAVMKKNLQIYFNIKSMVKFGKGDYLNIYDGYRIKIQELGLGQPKRELERFPFNIGIITALGGAAIQDILQTFKLDKFIGNIIIKNALVQGSQCPNSIISSIEWFEDNYNKNNQNKNQIDLLMITRGGGGWEDLVGFSNWELLIKLHQSKFLTLSAVGHQIDNQLTDEICDYKFATPSIGAKFIVETQQKYKSNFYGYKDILKQIIDKYKILRDKFYHTIDSNYTNIIKKYDMKDIIINIKKYSNQIKRILTQYTNLKNNFYSQLSNLKPTIIRKNELTSVEDFVATETDTEIKPKKIEIYFIDGMVGLSYKIIKYEKYN